MSGPREGYPQIHDPEHPLWAAQQDGWPDHLPHEAWAELAQHAQERRGSSKNHPVYAPDYIKNDLAETPEEAAALDAQAAKERR